MSKKIIIIDDSALMRRVISDIINSDNRFTVIATANNGFDGLEWLKANGRPDAVVLDINMPKMNGLELLKQLKVHNINVNVVMVSTVAKEGARETIEALELGAFDFVTKPESFIDVKSDNFKNKLLDCLSIATDVKGYSTKELKSIPEPKTKEIEQKVIKPIVQSNSQNSKQKSKLVALCCSTGGPKALQAVIPKLPHNLDATMLIVQHMPEGFTNSLAIRLNELSNMRVKEAVNDEIVEKGVIYIAKGGSQMRLVKQQKNTYKTVLTQEPPRDGLRPSANIMYESLMESDFDEIICVVLTGMGSDGTAGIRQLNNKKNIYVIAQDEKTSTVYGMPKAVAENGLVNEILPISKITEAIVKKVGVH